MLNYRFVNMLLLVFCVIFPVVFYWMSSSEGAWHRPYQLWLLAIASVWLWQRHKSYYEPRD